MMYPELYEKYLKDVDNYPYIDGKLDIKFIDEVTGYSCNIRRVNTTYRAYLNIRKSSIY